MVTPPYREESTNRSTIYIQKRKINHNFELSLPIKGSDEGLKMTGDKGTVVTMTSLWPH